MADEYATKPTIETLLNRLVGMEERLNIRLDRIEAETKQTRSEFLTLRADFRELKAELKEHLPTLK
ncbi:MAG TPA: hypothetical protein VM864_16455 [Pyrinomonadaceae bacterium]|jgi:hypothetical protein|nr:hypothetical protein [Pyrinomonadaceae bacterium]